MADKTPVDIIAEELFNDTYGGTSDPTIADLAEGIALSGAAKAIAAIEAAGYRIAKEPTEAMVDAMVRAWASEAAQPVDAGAQEGWREGPRRALGAALAAAPTWGGKE